MRALLNVEALFAWLVLVGAFLLRRGAGKAAEQSDGARWRLLLLAIPAALLWTVTFPLLSDDFVHISSALHFTASRIPGLFTIPASDRFFRPLGYLSYGVDALWTGRNPALWHLATLLFHFANCALVYRIGRQTGLTRAFAATAAAIFGIHGSRPEAVTWIACRFDLIATLFVLIAILLYLKPDRPALYVLALLAAFLGLLSKESAYVLPILLLIVGGVGRWRRTIPFAAMAAAVFLYRWRLLSGIGGYQTEAHTAAILNFNLFRTLNALLLRLWATLFFPINWTRNPQWWLSAALVLGAAGYLAIGLRGSRDRRALSFLLFALVAALPAQQLLLIAADLEKSRVLYLPSVGFALFLAFALQSLARPGWRLSAAMAIVVFQVACLEHNLIVWRGVAMAGEQACDSVAAALEGNRRSVTVQGLPNVLRGVYFFYTGMPECLEILHDVDPDRIRGRDGELVFQWDGKSDSMRRVAPRD